MIRRCSCCSGAARLAWGSEQFAAPINGAGGGSVLAVLGLVFDTFGEVFAEFRQVFLGDVLPKREVFVFAAVLTGRRFHHEFLALFALLVGFGVLFALVGLQLPRTHTGSHAVCGPRIGPRPGGPGRAAADPVLGCAGLLVESANGGAKAPGRAQQRWWPARILTMELCGDSTFAV